MKSEVQVSKFKEKLFTVANQIDEKLATIKKRGIVMVGLSKAGKSTCFNWIIGHTLKAIEEKNQVFYEPQVMMNGTAEVKPGFKSCTLVPNIYTLDDKTSLIDMQGFGDKRDYVGTLAVSYSLKAIFQSLEEIKFIIVIPEKAFTDNDGNQLCKSLNHLLSLFDIQNMDEEVKEQFFQSTALLVTRSKKPHKHIQYILSCIQKLEDEELENIDRREHIVELLNHLKTFNKIDQFKMAQVAIPAENCNIFKHYQSKNWDYFNLKKVESLKIITLPFEKQYKSMKKPDKEKFNSAIDHRLSSYKTFSDIFAKLFDKILVEKVIHDIKIPYLTFYKQIDQFIKENNHYDCQDKIKLNQITSVQFFKPQRETLMLLIMKIRDILIFPEDLLRQSEKVIAQVLSKAISQLIELISVIFCRNQKQLKKILQLKFILLRGVREFYMLLQVYKEKVVSSNNLIHDGLQMMIGENYKNNLLNFLFCFDMDKFQRITFGEKNMENPLEPYLKSRQNVYAFEVLFKIYEEDLLKLNSAAKDRYYQLLRDAKIIHAKYEYQLCNYRESSQYLLEAFHLEEKYELNCLHRVRYDLDKSIYNHYVEEMYLNQETILDMVKQNLVKLNKYNVALQLTKNMKWIHSTCQIYELKLHQKDLSKEDLIESIKEYAEYCLAHGRRQKGMELLQQLLEIQRTSFKNKKHINKIIQNNIEQQENLKLQYREFLQSLETIDLLDQTRKGVIVHIEKSLRDDNDLKAVIQFTKNYINNQAIFKQQNDDYEAKLMLKRYLQERLNNEAIVTQNGFKIQYLDDSADKYPLNKAKQQNYGSIIIHNGVELEQLSKKILKALQNVSKGLNNSKQKIITIDLDKVTKDYQQISEKHMIISLTKQEIRPTFQYATKIMNKVKKITHQSNEKLASMINTSKNALASFNSETEEYILERYYNKQRSDDQETQIGSNEASQSSSQALMASNRDEVRSIIKIIDEKPHAANATIIDRFTKQYPECVLLKSELNEIIDYVKDKFSKGLIKQVKSQLQNFDEINLSNSMVI